jgi:hypothetical protein
LPQNKNCPPPGEGNPSNLFLADQIFIRLITLNVTITPNKILSIYCFNEIWTENREKKVLVGRSKYGKEKGGEKCMSVQLIPQETKARRRFTPQHKLEILKEWEATGNGIEVAQKHELHPQTLYRWKKALEQGGPSVS